MFCRGICCFICTFLAVAIATGYSGQDFNTGSDSEVTMNPLRTASLQSSTSGPVHEVRPSTAVDLGALLDAGEGAVVVLTSSSARAESGSSSYHANQPNSDYSSYQTPTTAVPTTVAQTITSTDDVHISFLRSLPREEKTRRLMQAAKQGAVGELQALLVAGAAVAARDGNMRTALHRAAINGHEEAARRLLVAGAAVDARDRFQQTPLHYAAWEGDVAVVRLLLQNGADHGARDWARRTPLHLAAYEGHREAAAALLEAGADRAARDHWGYTPLKAARWSGNQQLVELLEGSSPTAGTRQK